MDFPFLIQRQIVSQNAPFHPGQGGYLIPGDPAMAPYQMPAQYYAHFHNLDQTMMVQDSRQASGPGRKQSSFRKKVSKASFRRMRSKKGRRSGDTSGDGPILEDTDVPGDAESISSLVLNHIESKTDKWRFVFYHQAAFDQLWPSLCYLFSEPSPPSHHLARVKNVKNQIENVAAKSRNEFN